MSAFPLSTEPAPLSAALRPVSVGLPGSPITPETVKAHMQAMGWSYRAAAKHVQRSYQWLCLVCNGKVKSRPVLVALANLPPRSTNK